MKHQSTINILLCSRRSDRRATLTRKLTMKLVLHPSRSGFILSNGDHVSTKHSCTISTQSRKGGKVLRCFTWVPSAPRPGSKGTIAGVYEPIILLVKFSRIHAPKGSLLSSTMVAICETPRLRDSCHPFVSNLATRTTFPALSLPPLPISP
jgi:hypothetical protein